MMLSQLRNYDYIARRPAARRLAARAGQPPRRGQRPAEAAVHLLHDEGPPDQRLRHPGRLRRRQCRPGAGGRVARTKSRRCSPRNRPRHPAARAAQRRTRAARQHPDPAGDARRDRGGAGGRRRFRRRTPRWPRLASAQGLAAQRQINYTRGNEAEADRLGIRTLARSGYDPNAMAGIFERMQALDAQQPGRREANARPTTCMTHPVTTTRISRGARSARRRWRRREARFTPAFSHERQPAAAWPRCRSRPRRGGGDKRPVRLGRANACACSAPTRRPRRSTNTNGCAARGNAERRAALRAGLCPPARRPGRSRGQRPGAAARQAPGRSLAGAGDGRGRSACRQGGRGRRPLRGDCWRGCRDNRAVALTYAAVLAERNNAGRRQARAGGPAAAAGRSRRRSGVPDRPSRAPTRSPATRSAPARPMPRPPTSTAAPSRRWSSSTP